MARRYVFRLRQPVAVGLLEPASIQISCTFGAPCIQMDAGIGLAFMDRFYHLTTQAGVEVECCNIFGFLASRVALRFPRRYFQSHPCR